MMDYLIVVVALQKLMTLIKIPPFHDGDMLKLLQRSPIQKSQEERERTAIKIKRTMIISTTVKL